MQVTSSEQYQRMLQDFLTRLRAAIPHAENAAVDIHPADPMLRMQYGNSAMVASLETKSSGHDKYIIWIDNSGQGQFIRMIGG